jgi:hypothetical protein
MKLTKIISMATFLAMLMACTEPVDVTPFTYPQVFTGEVRQGWSIRSVQLLQDGKGTQTFQLDQCITDDIYIFYNNPERTYQVTEGATKCNDGDPTLIVDSNWGFTNSTAQLTMVMPLLSVDPLPFVLKEVDGVKMTLDIYFDDNHSSYRFNFKPASLE